MVGRRPKAQLAKSKARFVLLFGNREHARETGQQPGAASARPGPAARAQVGGAGSGRALVPPGRLW